MHMASKTVPLSARISDDDADFLARLAVPGAITPSDKLRAIITDARRRQEGFTDYAGCLAMLQEMLAPTVRRIRETNNRENVHSDLLSRLADWLPETMAWFVTGAPPAKAKDDAPRLEALEAGLADRVVALLESFLRLGVTSQAPCYDKTAVARRLGPVLELAGIIKNNTSNQ